MDTGGEMQRLLWVLAVALMVTGCRPTKCKGTITGPNEMHKDSVVMKCR